MYDYFSRIQVLSTIYSCFLFSQDNLYQEFSKIAKYISILKEKQSKTEYLIFSFASIIEIENRKADSTQGNTVMNCDLCSMSATNF